MSRPGGTLADTRGSGRRGKCVVQPRCDLLGGQHANACSGELEGERDAVESPANVAHCACVAIRELERCERRLRAFDKKLNRLGAAEGWNEPRRLAGDAEGLAARREDAQSRAAPEELFRELRGRVDQVLAVVEHEKHGRVGDRGDERLDRSAAAVRDVEGGGDFAADDRWIRDGCEIDPGDTRVPACLGCRDLACESRFSAAAGAGQCEETGATDKPCELGELMAATDEPRQVDGEVCRGGLVREGRRRRGRGRRHSGGRGKRTEGSGPQH